MKLLDMTVLLSENSMGIYPAGLKVKPDVFLHDICELIFCQPVFFLRFRTKNEKQDSFTTARRVFSSVFQSLCDV
jgi:hypothetical protein